MTIDEKTIKEIPVSELLVYKKLSLPDFLKAIPEGKARLYPTKRFAQIQTQVAAAAVRIAPERRYRTRSDKEAGGLWIWWEPRS